MNKIMSALGGSASGGKKILISVSIIAGVAAIVVGATTAFFSDTETSTGNTFTAGSIDLKVDNECHWSGGEECPWHEQGDMLANWALNDLKNSVHKFFYFTDLKPGDWGEDTISLHVYDNDAWGRIYLDGVTDSENDCTEPESVDEVNCVEGTEQDGELDDYMQAMIWLDQGDIDGFQCSDKKIEEGARCEDDSKEGDNMWQENEPVIVYDDITADWTYDLAEVLKRAGTGPGLTIDGHMVGSITYYFGVGWCFGGWDDSTCDGSYVDNSSQSDSLSGNLNFQVEQYRNQEGGPPSWD
ncbi:MAG: SipW-dependent-type signal peptide-containing protein [bacterium]